jgi:hypothetical protein
MVYDLARNRIVLFGGRQGTIMFGDTWEFDGSNWAQMDVRGPPNKWASAIEYNSDKGRTILFGGQGADLYGDIWAWNGTI